MYYIYILCRCIRVSEVFVAMATDEKEVYIHKLILAPKFTLNHPHMYIRIMEML